MFRSPETKSSLNRHQRWSESQQWAINVIDEGAINGRGLGTPFEVDCYQLGNLR